MFEEWHQHNYRGWNLPLIGFRLILLFLSLFVAPPPFVLFFFLVLRFFSQGRRWEMEDSHIVADNAFTFWEHLAEEEGRDKNQETNKPKIKTKKIKPKRQNQKNKTKKTKPKKQNQKNKTKKTKPTTNSKKLKKPETFSSLLSLPPSISLSFQN